jgi:RimJ/RimL family protein N-acetyltransferase
MHSIGVIDTPRLTLRRLQDTDAVFVLELLNQPSFIQFIGDRNVRTLEQARGYIDNNPLRSYTAHGYGLLLTQLKADATPIGMCGLVKREYFPDPDIGFAFLPAFWSQGFALEAATAVIDYASATLGIRRLLAIVQPDNAASIKLLGKLGFTGDRVFKSATTEPELLLLARQR